MKSRLAVGSPVFVVSNVACTSVAPAGRGKLAGPMTPADELEAPLASYILSVKKGAIGERSLAESGRGCN
jgi:hypothetical protein